MTRLTAVLLMLALPAAFAGCLGADEAPEGTVEPAAAAPVEAPMVPDPVTLAVSTSGAYPVNPGFSPASLSAVAGQEVTVTLTNAEMLPLVPHDWVLEGVEGATTGSIAPGSEGSVTFIAPEAGEYVFFCSIGDHRERGMVGTFTVTAA